MAEEHPPTEQQAQANEPAPMMTFTELEALAKAQADGGQGQQEGQQHVSGQEPAPADAGQAQADPFTEALSKKGFKKPEDLLKSYEEAHAKITQLAQERSKLAQDMEVLMQLQQQFAGQSGQAPQPGEPGQGDFNDELYKEIAPKVQQDARNMVQAVLHEERVKERVAQIAKENPEEFNDLLPIMQNLAKQYPQVSALPNGVEMVYQKAKEIRGQRVNRLLKSVFGDNVDLDKMRAFFSQQQQGEVGNQPPAQPGINQEVARAAYLPSSTPASQQSQKQDPDMRIRELNQAPKLSRTHVDQVTDVWWEKVMSQAQVQK